MATGLKSPFGATNTGLLERTTDVEAVASISAVQRSIRAIRAQIEETAQELLQRSGQMAGVGAAFMALGGQYLNLSKRLSKASKAFTNVSKEIGKVEATFAEVGKLLSDTERDSRGILSDIDVLGSRINEIAN